MHLPKLLVIFSMIWTTPTSGLPLIYGTGGTKIQKRADQNQDDSSQVSNNLLIGGGLLGAGFVVGRLSNRQRPGPDNEELHFKIEESQSKIEELQRQIRIGDHELMSALQKTDNKIPEPAKVAELEAEISNLRRYLQFMLNRVYFAQAFGLKRGDPERLQQVLKTLNEGPREVRECINREMGVSPLGEWKAITGEKWNDAVNKCNGDGRLLYIHPDSYHETATWSGNQVTQTEQQPSKEDGQPGDNQNFSFTPVRLFGDRLIHILGGTIPNVQKKPSFNAMPTGMPNLGRAPLPAFGAP